MPFQPHTVLITGGATGIGRGLAEALHARGSKVIVAGRRHDLLAQLCAQHPGMHAQTLDVASAESIRAAVRELTQSHPKLDCVINNAGMQRSVDLGAEAPAPLDFANAELDANVRGLMMMCAAFVPHLRTARGATLINVTSGLAFSPMASVPVYCATKAAVRSFTLSLRLQLRPVGIRVIELIPPAVQTDLHDYMGPHGKQVGMPLDAFMAEALAGLDRGDDEVAVGHAKQGLAASHAAFDATFASMNSRRDG